MNRISLKAKQAKALNQLITTNKAALKAGSNLSEADLCAWFNIPTVSPFEDALTVQKYNMKKLSAYTTLNKQLAKRGLVIKASNYYTSFKVLTVPETEHKVERLKAVSQAKATRASILRQGATTYRSKWTKLKSTEL